MKVFKGQIEWGEAARPGFPPDGETGNGDTKSLLRQACACASRLDAALLALHYKSLQRLKSEFPKK
jgi:hypothetical protein